MVNKEKWEELVIELSATSTKLVAVSKTKPASDIEALYSLGQKDFGENYVQELVEKEAILPKDIHWHFIGHLQTNKVKYIAPFVYLIHGVDNYKLLLEINKQAKKNNRVINVLLQMHIAQEETKYGMSSEELKECVATYINDRTNHNHVNICGLMGMASFTDDEATVTNEFQNLQRIFSELKQTYFPNDANFSTCSMGMSGDYKLAIKYGSTLVRIGSMLFGSRNSTV